MGERKGVYRVLVGKPEGKRPPGRFRRRWEDIFIVMSRYSYCMFMCVSSSCQLADFDYPDSGFSVPFPQL